MADASSTRRLSKPQRLTLERMVAGEMVLAAGATGSELAEVRRKALDYYYLKPRGDEEAGLSSVISSDIRDMVAAVTAQIVPMISTDAVAEFEPEGAQDEEQSRAESAAVNQVIIEQLGGFLEIEDSARDALLMRNGCIKVWAEEIETSNTVAVPSGIDIGDMLIPSGPGERRQIIDDDTIRVITTEVRFHFESVPIDQVLWRAEWPARNLDDCPFVGHVHFLTRSELIERGVKRSIIDDLPATTERFQATGSARARSRSNQTGLEAQTKDQDAIEVVEAWVLVDLDGDGISERYRVLVATIQGENGEGTLLEWELAAWVPLAIGSAMLGAQRLEGESLYDSLAPIQDAKTDATRQWLDNLALGNNHHMVVNDAVANVEDALSLKSGRVIRTRDVDQVRPMVFTDTGQSSAALLSYLDTRRTEAGGAALDMASSNAQLVNTQTADGTERQFASRELMVSLFAKNLSETLIGPAWRLMHRTMRTWSNKPLQMRLGGDWVTVDPSSWPERIRINLKVGLSVGARAHMQKSLLQVIQLQISAMTQGKDGILVSDRSIYAATMDWLSSSGIEAPERYMINPASQASQQAAQGAQQQQAQGKVEQQELIAAQLRIENDKLAADLKKAEEELRFKYAKLAAETEVEEAKLVGGAAVELERHSMDKARGHNNGRERETDGAAGGDHR